MATFIGNLWSFENPQHLGLADGLYFPFTTANGNTDLGPGIDMSKQSESFKVRASKGFTPAEIDKEVTDRVKNQLSSVDEALSYHTDYPDTVSP